MKSFVLGTLGVFAAVSLLAIGFVAGTTVGPRQPVVIGQPLSPTTPIASTAVPTAVANQAPSQSELKAAADRASFLMTRYGVPEKEVTQLTKTTYDLATMIGLTQDNRTLLHQNVLYFAENGGPELRQFGIEGDDESVARMVGSNAAGLRAFTPGQVVELRANMAIAGLSKYMLGK